METTTEKKLTLEEAAGAVRNRMLRLRDARAEHAKSVAALNHTDKASQRAQHELRWAHHDLACVCARECGVDGPHPPNADREYAAV